jgi:ribosomal protein L10
MLAICALFDVSIFLIYNFVLFYQQLLDEYPKCFIVGADNVGSRQMQRIRMSLRGSGSKD